MNFGSLFTGIGGFDLGFERAGMQCLWQVEIDNRCQDVLSHHWPTVEKYSDVRTVGKHNLAAVDLICGGFPCQDVSLAGNRIGLEGKRSTLWTEFVRIVREIMPRWVMVENVIGLFTSDDGRFFGKILRDLAESGYDAEWDVLSASAFGYPHLRERVILVAYPNTYRLETNADNSLLCEQTADARQYGYNSSGSSPIIFCTEPERKKILPFSEALGVDDGLPIGMDKRRLGMCGNAIVPDIAEWIGRRIIELDRILYYSKFTNPNDAKIGKSVTIGAKDDAIVDSKFPTT